MRFKASAPGSLMLLGEFGVLYGKHSLVCAIDKRITVTLTPRLDDRIEINSTLHGQYITRLSEIQIEKPFQFVLGVVRQQLAKLKHGYDILIESEFSDQFGFGSSAAVTVATLAAFITHFNVRITPLELIRQARLIVRQIQSLGSGADVAASVYGGMVGYCAQPLSAEKLQATYPLTACYAGYKTPTPEVIELVEAQFASQPVLLRAITHSIGQCAVEGIACARKALWPELGKVMKVQQNMMEALGVSTPDLRAMVETLGAEPGILGAKISGSGLGDCIIGLGKVEEPKPSYLPIAIALQGVTCEKI